MLTDDQLAGWLAAHGVEPADVAELVDKHRGATEDDMDELNDEVNGPMA